MPLKGNYYSEAPATVPDRKIRIRIQLDQAQKAEPKRKVHTGKLGLVKIYGRGPYTLSWHEPDPDRKALPGRKAKMIRRRLVRAGWETARRDADAKEIELLNRQTWMKDVSPNDIALLRRAQEIILPTGKPLDLVASEYAELYALCAAKKTTLAEMVRFAIEHQPAAGRCRHVPVIVEEMLLARESDGAAENTLDDLKSRLRRFAASFTGPLIGVAGRQINEWLRTLRQRKKDGTLLSHFVSRRTRNNYRDAIRELFRYAKECGDLPKNWDAFDDVVRVRNEEIEIEIFTPEELAKLLAHTLPNMVPFTALGAFATVRHEEMCAPNRPVLDWRQIDFVKKEIHILEKVARKIGQDRLIPMQPNLETWLQPYAKPNGPICELSNASNALARAAERAGIKWKANGLRKSSISYRLAILQDMGKVALEAGTSQERIRKNYKKTVSESEAKRWYQITRPDPIDVLPIFAWANRS